MVHGYINILSFYYCRHMRVLLNIIFLMLILLLWIVNIVFNILLDHTCNCNISNILSFLMWSINKNKYNAVFFRRVIPDFCSFNKKKTECKISFIHRPHRSDKVMQHVQLLPYHSRSMNERYFSFIFLKEQKSGVTLQ